MIIKNVEIYPFIWARPSLYGMRLNHHHFDWTYIKHKDKILFQLCAN